MRVTNNMLRRDALTSLGVNASALQRLQEQVSTTKQLNRPSDDPAQVRAAVKLRDGLAELEQYQRNVDTANRTLSASESALSSAGDIMQRANELAVEGANGTLSPDQLKAIGVEVDQLRQSLVQLAGTAVGDTHVFSGFKTDTVPYASPAAAYAGDGNAIMARIAPGSQVQVNIPGDVAFGPAFDALNKLYAETSAGTQVSGATLGAVDVGQQAILDARATIGARQNRLDATSQTLDDGILASKTLQSKIEDVDIAAAISDLSSRQATYQAALAVNAKVLQASLIDYLT